MGASASVHPDPVEIEPGGEESIWIKIRNTGDIVDEFVFEILGEPAHWVELEPRSLPLFPGAEGELKLTFRPPRHPTTRAGSLPFGVKISSKENPADAIVEEGMLAVAPFVDTTADLTPRTSHGRFGGKHELAFDNRGNVPLEGVLAGGDPDGHLRFRFRPPTLAAAAGTATFAKLHARPSKRLLWGQPKTYPFTVQVAAEEQPPVSVDGTVVQQALIPRWLVPALLALGVLAALWALVLRPGIESTARDAAKDEQQKLQVQVKQQTAATKDLQRALTAQTDQQGDATRDLQNDVAKLEKQTGPGAPRVSVKAPVVNVANNVSTGIPKGTPKGVRLQASCRARCTVSFPVARGQTFSLTDIVLGNPQGDTGTLTLQRAGQVLLVEALANFRDLDFHFIAPIVVSGGQSLTLVVDCENAASTNSEVTGATSASGAAERAAASAAAAAAPCSAAAYLAGFNAQAKSKKG